jgi:hypothetical protein
MARSKEVVSAYLAQKAKAELNKVPDHKICLRLQAIISSADYPLDTVSAVLGASRQTIWRWVKRFASKGVAGLYDNTIRSSTCQVKQGAM